MEPARGSLIRLAPSFDLGLVSVVPTGPGVGGGGLLSNIPLSNPLRLLHSGANHLFDPRHPAGSSCKECPESWLPFQGSCYFFSTLRATWVEAQQHCERSGAHLVIVGGLEEQVRSPGCLGEGRGLKAFTRGGVARGQRGGRAPPAQFSPLPRVS